MKNIILKDFKCNVGSWLVVIVLVGLFSYGEVFADGNIDLVTLKCIVVDSGTNKNFPVGEGSFEGAIYSLYDNDNKLIGSYSTDSSGKFYVNDLVMGTYYIVQDKASLGYKVNKNRIKIEVNKNNMEVKLSQEIISNKFILKKYYGFNGEYNAERSVLFTVYDNDNKRYSYVITDYFGEARFTLPYGTFRLEQLTTTDGYFKVDDFYITIKEQTDEVVKYSLYDELVRVRLKVVSLDEEGNRNIGSVFSYMLKRKGENTYIEVDGNSVFSSDIDGVVLIPGFLECGEYVLEQVSVPLGIILNDKLIEFKVDNESIVELVDSNYIMEININNDLVKGRVNISTLEEVSNEYGDVNRENVNIILSALDDIVVNGKVMYKSGQVVFEGSTDENGSLLIDNLYLGSYCAIDIDNNIKKCFELNSINGKESIIEERIEILKNDNKIDINNSNDIIDTNKSDKIVEVPSTLTEDIGFYKGVMVLFIVGVGMFVYKKIFVSNI